MISLALDASSDRLSVAAAAGGLTARREASGAKRHAGLLVPLVLEALAEVGASPADVSRLILADGPGGFTGLRVTAAWAKGFCRRPGVAVYAVSTLLVRARAAAEGRLVLGVASALRNELYVGGYRFEGGAVSTVLPPMVLASGAAPPVEGVDVVVGDVSAAVLYGWRFDPATPIIVGPAGMPDAGRMIELADQAGGTVRIEDLGRWEPTYGRPAEAQAKWERLHGRTLPDSAGNPG